MKPAWRKFAGKWNATINIAVSFILGLVASFSVAPYLNVELNNGLLAILWLALGTWSNLFYDIRNIVKWLWDKLRTLKE